MPARRAGSEQQPERDARVRHRRPSARHASAIAAALACQRCRSRPIAAAGTRPNGDSAEYRPPIDGTPEKMRRKPSRAATASSFDPGSVIATKCRPACAAPTRSDHALEEIRAEDVGLERRARLAGDDHQRRARDRRARSTAATCAGSVESSTCRRGPPGSCPKDSARTSGHRLEPPMPSSRTSREAVGAHLGAEGLERRQLAARCRRAHSASRATSLSSAPVQSEASRPRAARCCRPRPRRRRRRSSSPRSGSAMGRRYAHERLAVAMRVSRLGLERLDLRPAGARAARRR